MAAKNCENCGQRVESNSGVTGGPLTLLEALYQYRHTFCCAQCRDRYYSGKSPSFFLKVYRFCLIVFVIGFILYVLAGLAAK
ncbi:MAG: hypothetical protein MJ016_04930 [Victivallaceae bacterium]|nr:hypothetical protein [Victivallaceae bacterium]